MSVSQKKSLRLLRRLFLIQRSLEVVPVCMPRAPLNPPLIK